MASNVRLNFPTDRPPSRLTDRLAWRSSGGGGGHRRPAASGPRTHTRLQESGDKRVERARYVGFVSTKAKKPRFIQVAFFLGADVDVEEEEGRHAEVASAHRETTTSIDRGGSLSVCVPIQ